jgi:hypothetical protein
MSKLSALVARARVILTAAVTWISAASVLAGYVVNNATDFPPLLVQGATSLIAVIAIIRRVAPVAKSERGVI